MKKIKIILAIIAPLAIMLMHSCAKDELDFKKSYTASGEFGAPIVVLDLNMKKLLKEDSIVKFDPNGLIRFVIKKDSVANFSADSMLGVPPQTPFTTKSSIGEITITDIAVANLRTLNNISSSFSTPTRNAILAIAGTNAIFPAVNDASTSPTNMSVPASFSSLTCSGGYLIMELRNRFPITINKLRLNLYNMVPFQSFFGGFTFQNIPPGGTKRDSLPLSGVQITNNISYTIPEFKSYESPQPVFVNMDDSITFLMSTVGLKAAGGVAKIPNQTVGARNIELNLASSNADSRIRKMRFKTGRIKYTLTSTIKELVKIKIAFPGATKNAAPFAPIEISVIDATSNGYINIDDVLFDLATDPGQPYNKLITSIEPQLVSSGQHKPFDSSDYVSGNFEMEDLKLGYAEGFLGTKNLPITSNTVDAKMFDAFGNGLKFTEPVMRITTSNSIGLPVKIALNVSGESKSGQIVNLGAPVYDVPYPSIAEGNITKNGFIAFDKNNSNIATLLALPPTKLSFSGNADVNLGGFQGVYTNSIYDNAKIVVGYEMDIPFSLMSPDLTMQDTTSSPFPKASKPVASEADIKDNEYPKLAEYADLVFKIENGFPFDGGLQLLFIDTATKQIIDSVEAPLLFGSAIPDITGGSNVTKTTTVSSLRLSYPTLLKIYLHPKPDNVRMIFKAKLSTYSNGTQPVRIYNTYTTRIGLSIKFKYKFKLTSK